MVEWAIAGARNQPLVLVFEDLQWFDPTSIDLVHALSDRGAQAPILILATARPEFRPPWVLKPHHKVISLAPLDEAQVQRMIAELAFRRTLSTQVTKRVSDRAGGVPLFVEEVTRLILERGEQGAAQAIPPTLQAVAGGAARPAGIGARGRADRRGAGAKLLLCRFCATSRLTRSRPNSGTRRSLASIRLGAVSWTQTFSSSMASRRRRPTASSMR